jgi:glycosyltransferase involved in cell wall biosynthesis
MKISVITATYNRASTIVRAIFSVKSQSYKNIELVVIDGASKDATIELVTPLISSTDVIQSEPDTGIYEALNKGVQISSGDVIAFLHSDDLYFDDNVLSNVMKILKDDNIDIVYGDVSFFAKDNHEKVTRTYRSDKLSEANLAWGKMPAHPAMFIKRRVYKKIGLFKTDYKIAADYEFLCRMVRNADFRAVYLPAVLVRMQLGGISTASLRSSILLNKEVYRAVLDNGMYTNILMLLSKYPSKIFQFLKKS